MLQQDLTISLLGGTQCSILQALLGQIHCVLRNKKTQNPKYFGRKLVNKQSSKGPASEKRSMSKPCGKASGKQFSSPRRCFSGMGEGASRGGEQEPKRQVHFGGPLRKSCGFDRTGKPLARRSKFRVAQDRAWAVASPVRSFLSSDSMFCFGNPGSVQSNRNFLVDEHKYRKLCCLHNWNPCWGSVEVGGARPSGTEVTERDRVISVTKPAQVGPMFATGIGSIVCGRLLGCVAFARIRRWGLRPRQLERRRTPEAGISKAPDGTGRRALAPGQISSAHWR